MASDINREETLDTLGAHRLLLKQPRDGYRFSIDSLLLWGFLRPAPREHWVDLGTGCGILAIALAKINHVSKVTAVEIQPTLVAYARENLRLNQVEDQIHLIEGDIRNTWILQEIAPADGVCANPPYYKTFTGRLNKNQEKALARHEIMGTVEDFLKTGLSLLRRGGQFSTILPVARLTEALPLFSAARLYPAHIRFVHPFDDQPATHFLITAVKGKQEAFTLHPPLILYQGQNCYTPELDALMTLNPLRFP